MALEADNHTHRNAQQTQHHTRRTTMTSPWAAGLIFPLRRGLAMYNRQMNDNMLAGLLETQMTI